jgi:CRP/FNR family transcriptional regulator, cyclic AMP receptor protein
MMASIDFLDALPPDARAALRERGTVRRFSRGTALFHERQPPDRVIVLLSGRVKLCAATADGREVIFEVRGPGEGVLGELGAIDGQPRVASALALEPVEALVIPTADFIAVVERFPQVATVLLKMLAQRLRESDLRRIEYAAYDTVGRVAARLVELAQRYGQQTAEGVQIDLSITQEELAGWTGASREALIKALQALRQLGWIDTRRRSIRVRDLEALRRRAS